VRELRPLCAAVNRVHELEATPGVSPAEIAAARHTVYVSAVELTRLADAMKLYQEEGDRALFRASVTSHRSRAREIAVSAAHDDERYCHYATHVTGFAPACGQGGAWSYEYVA